jgi:nucleoside-diphosphate-sugar epimerase
MKETVFITGASGMLGVELVPALCAHPNVERVIVLVRNTAVEFPGPKLHAVTGDVSLQDLGLKPADRQMIASSVSSIIHGAASTSFASELSLAREVNVGGTANLLRLAGDCRRLRALCHLSTVYVAGKRTGVVREDELEHACGFVNAYEQSKFEAELLLRSYFDRLPISIVRLSTIVCNSQNGAVSRLGAFHHALRFFFHSLAPMVPGTAESPVDLVALDYAARSVAALALDQCAPGRTWHVCGGADALSLEELFDLTQQLFYDYRPAWRKRAIEKPAIVNLRTYELFVRSVEEVGDSALKDSVAVLKYFAPQLSYPKLISDPDTLAALAAAGVVRPRIRHYYPRLIRFLLENSWQPAARMQAVS